MTSKDIEQEIEQLRNNINSLKKKFIRQLAKELNISSIKISTRLDSNDERIFMIAEINNMDIKDARFDLIKFHSYENRIHNNKYREKNILTDSVKALLIVNNLKEEDFFYFGKSILMLSDFCLNNCVGESKTIDDFVVYI